MHSEKLVVITSFPEKGAVHGHKVVGIASYAKNTLLALRKYNKNLKVTVLAEKLDSKAQDYLDNGMFIKRVWKRNSLLSFFGLLRQTLSLSKDTNNILIEFEVAMFGNIPYLLPFPLFILILRLFGKKVTIVSHQVITDIKELSGHINLKGSLYTGILNFFIHNFYRLMLLLSNRVIVFDDALKTNLSRFGDLNKIKVIPHGVEVFDNLIAKNEARMKIGLLPDDFVVLAFGFLAWYKGSDWLINEFKEINSEYPKIKLIVAGGPNPNHLDKKFYRDYINKIKRACVKSNIILTGFVKEEDIPYYFQASDVIALPYRTMMSSSGPLSIAFSFKKPFLVSKQLSPLFETSDLKTLLKKEGINQRELIFDLNSDFNRKIISLYTNIENVDKYQKLSGELANLRLWDKIGGKYYDELFKY
jgi:glycosyltransferase involved in cell wall biosynthesis